MTALEPDPDDRFQDADAMRVALEQIARELGLALGSTALIRALERLFPPRPEPWFAGARGDFRRGQPAGGLRQRTDARDRTAHAIADPARERHRVARARDRHRRDRLLHRRRSGARTGRSSPTFTISRRNRSSDRCPFAPNTRSRHSAARPTRWSRRRCCRPRSKSSSTITPSTDLPRRPQDHAVENHAIDGPPLFQLARDHSRSIARSAAADDHHADAVHSLADRLHAERALADSPCRVRSRGRRRR